MFQHIYYICEGNLFVRKVDTMNANCTVKQSYSWSGYTCDKTLDQDYTWNSFWYTTVWKGAIGTWIKIDLPRYLLSYPKCYQIFCNRQAYVESIRLLQSYYYQYRANKKVCLAFHVIMEICKNLLLISWSQNCDITNSVQLSE